ncbi:DEAD/DEAH box helicase family protein [Prevotella sp. P3-122]|uniref:DEAD/DEAH box helicase family protein n=1 Tax=Prevotella sp. P3-122 TaxID=2024223 RepID=UPI000B9780AD|nr:DEAD/DEAH box helicase family protein [Prevotella sp. P3-122]OYP60798.1 restriction endonuclease subunit R [Prevotella sp. P3-122]
MKVTLFPFQQIAVTSLRQASAEALGGYQRTHTPQIVSFTAPTGAGKTIIMSALIEDILFGTDVYPDQQDAIFLWISDSPELNLQSKQKIDLKADRITLQQTVTIEESGFDQEILEDGHIYFLNTQKLSTSSNLCKYGDTRHYTIWDTLRNTIQEKSDRLYVIIDEAHRGMQGRKAGQATTIMQKFIMGDRTNNLPVMPVVIGMSATIQRFNTLAGNTTSTIQRVTVEAEQVRRSGLLKDQIIVNYPEEGATTNEMAILQAATDEWVDKWNHWHQYCYEQHYAYVNPVFVIQVENSNHDSRYSDTDLAECLRKIEARIGKKLQEGEVVHTFGQTASDITINGLDVKYREPSQIADDRKIKIVFFKENLSTGWDCPRAECMMSFRRANDITNIAQLLGRMVRTPMQMHIAVDDSLNNVHLFLPRFNQENVQKVINELQNAEGADIPVDMSAESMENPTTETLSIRPTRRVEVQSPNAQTQTQSTASEQNVQSVQQEEVTRQDSENRQESIVLNTPTIDTIPSVTTIDNSVVNTESTNQESISTETVVDLVPQKITDSETQSPEQENEPQYEATSEEYIPQYIEEIVVDGIPRDEIMKFINDSGLLSYDIRTVRITNYLSSLFSICRFLSQTGLNAVEINSVKREIINKIHDYAEGLRNSGRYDALANKVMEFKLASQAFDVFGNRITDNPLGPLFSATDTDLDRQLRLADSKLHNEGIAQLYGNLFYNPDNENEFKIDVILFAVEQNCIDGLMEYAKNKFHDLVDQYRRQIITLDERDQEKYNRIVSNGDEVSEHNFRLPENINVSLEINGKKYKKHLFVDSNCEATFRLNGWEEALLKEEMEREDFVCWLRNPSRKPWALCMPYEMNGQIRAMYPDFIIIRKDAAGYLIDILEPHDQTRTDNLPKAIGLAKYAARNPGAGRIQLIHMNGGALRRLDLSRSQVRDRVLIASSDHDLNNVFTSYME